jgi:NAD-dependent deacetylase
MSCGKECSMEEFEALIPQRCRCGGTVKPDVVFFGEPVQRFYEASLAVKRAGLLLVLGSSLAVAPASLFPFMCEGEIVIVNRGPVVSLPPGALLVEMDTDSFLRDCSRYL